MEEVRNSSDKLVCKIDRKAKAIEIAVKGCITLIRFSDDGNVVIKNICKTA